MCTLEGHGVTVTWTHEGTKHKASEKIKRQQGIIAAVACCSSKYEWVVDDTDQGSGCSGFHRPCLTAHRNGTAGA